MMDTIDRLRRDHGLLRAKLDVLESALRLGPETWFVLREVCFTLSRQLRHHIRREEELVAACRKAMNPKVLAEVVVEHHDEPQLLRTINRLFVTETGHALDRIKPALLEVIHGLRRHMKEEEAELFPILERVLGQESGASAPMLPPSKLLLEETMTVNRVLHQFPTTKRVFDQLFINVPLEGCTCLDEVAWRHGMDSGELLNTLDQAVRVCACMTPTPQKTREQTPESSTPEMVTIS